ncbi:MAG: rhomboid family intramembrane serine protease [Burkholderiales bacterium]|nr:rhomboid family intramembrane serine protease [Burkholderiales bacterium]
MLGPVVIAYFALWTPGGMPGSGAPDFQIWQLLTYGFLHGSFMHLAFNMLALWMFGRDVEKVLGSKRYVHYYLACVLTAAAAQLLVSQITNSPPYPTVGASGGVFGLLLAFGMLFPRRVVMLIFPPIPMPARIFVIVYGVIELVLGVTGTQSGVAHFAHLGGIAGGFFLLQYWRGGWPFSSGAPRPRR